MERIINIDGVDYELTSIKEDKNSWGLVIKNLKTKKKKIFSEFFYYHQGWSQGTNRSVMGYYLNTKFYGSVGNGSGISSMSKPYITYNIAEFIREGLIGKHYSEEVNDYFKQ